MKGVLFYVRQKMGPLVTYYPRILCSKLIGFFFLLSLVASSSSPATREFYFKHVFPSVPLTFSNSPIPPLRTSVLSS